MTKILAIPASIDLQGHRGCRGLLPENSIPAFIKALELGVTTLEMDTVITKDKQVVVSHDPFLSHETCLDLNKQEIAEADEKSYNIYRMSYEQLKQYDCGTKVHPRFPGQQKMPVYKPLLKEVITTAEKFVRDNRLPAIKYNIEIKSTLQTDNIFHPSPEEFAELLIQVLYDERIVDRTTIQCFDVRPLQYIKNKYPEITLSYLIENTNSPEKNLSLLGFTPPIYSPEFPLVNEQLIAFAKEKKMKVLPWTVNTIAEAEQLIKLEVDGIITDYPNLFKRHN